MAIGTVGTGPSPDNYPGIVAILDEFATAAGAAASRLQMSRRGTSSAPAATLGPTVERGLVALDALYELRLRVPDLVNGSALGPEKGMSSSQHKFELEGLRRSPIYTAWGTFWLPLLLTIAKHSVNGSRDIRQRAIGYLQRVLLSSQLLTDRDAALTAIFGRVLFPVIEELLKPQVYNQDPPGFEETRLRASTLLCKAFLQYLTPLSEDPKRVLELFLRVTDLLERFMRTGSRQLVSLVSIVDALIAS